MHATPTMYLNFRERHVQHDWVKWQQKDCSWKELFLCLFLTTKLHWTEKTHAGMHTGHFVQILLPPLEVIIFEGQGQGLSASSLEVPCSYISWNFLLLKITWEIALFQLQSCSISRTNMQVERFKVHVNSPLCLGMELVQATKPD